MSKPELCDALARYAQTRQVRIDSYCARRVGCARGPDGIMRSCRAFGRLAPAGGGCFPALGRPRWPVRGRATRLRAWRSDYNTTTDSDAPLYL